MGCGASGENASTAPTVKPPVPSGAKCHVQGDIGGSVCNPGAPVGAITIVPVLPTLELGTVLVFDNKGGDDTRPRVGILANPNGEVHVISKGNSPVLTAQDLECIQLIDGDTNMYSAFTSLGRVYSFTITCKQDEAGKSYLECADVAQGQLPVADGESFESWQHPNRCNIEATWLMSDDESPTGRTLFWAGRGGDAMSSWYKRAHFDGQKAAVFTETVIDGTMKNVLGNPDYRTVSCMDGVPVDGGKGAHLYFASAFDGEEKGNALNVDGDQTAAANKKAFKSVIARTELPSGKTTIVARYDGVKIEALSMIHDADGKATGVELFSDDEALGSLVGVLPVGPGTDSAVNATEFVDLASATEKATGVQKKRFGCSGCSCSCQATREYVTK